jgi:hypothetical protein
MLIWRWEIGFACASRILVAVLIGVSYDWAPILASSAKAAAGVYCCPAASWSAASNSS